MNRPNNAATSVLRDDSEGGAESQIMVSRLRRDGFLGTCRHKLENAQGH